MNKIELINFLENFEIEKSKINEFLRGKKVMGNDGNFFLVENNENFKKNQMQMGILIFIKLVKFLPSKILLKFIKNNTQNIIEIKNEKQSLNFTYSKKILIESTTKPKGKFNLNKSYIVMYKNNILGYANFVNKSGNFYFDNQVNLGHYLKENI